MAKQATACSSDTPWARVTKNVKKRQVKKDEHLENNKKNVTWGSNEFFEFLNVRSFSPEHPLDSNMCN